MGADNLKELESASITELNLGDVRLRRKIARAGFNNILELLSLGDTVIDERFEPDDADAIIRLKERYERDPEGFARSVMEKPKPRSEMPAAIVRERRQDPPAKRDAIPPIKRKVQATERLDGPASLPDRPFSEKLLEYEKRAKAELDSLADQYEDVMVFQAFDEFATELDEVSEAFQSLFEHYRNHSRSALSLADRELGNVFLVYVADLARREYDGANLWGNLFGKIGIADGNLQAEFKRAFSRHLERRHMPLYAADEEANHYFYTALLHGGLSSDSWDSLWTKSLLPLAKEAARANYGLGTELDGHAILKRIKDPESRFAPKKSVLNILEKAPDYTIAPLFEASLRVASQVESSKSPVSGFTMLTSYGLPDVAMQALRECKEKAASRQQGLRMGKAAGSQEGRSRIVYLPEAKLLLDLGEGLVYLRWGKQQFPMSFMGRRIDYYVDGKLMMSRNFDSGVGKCILGEAKISVRPQARYEIKINLMEQSESGEWEMIGFLEQSFSRSKPGCFEFVRDSSGLYRLRGKSERINRLRRIAYIIKEGFGIEPGQGMTPISEYDTTETWGDAQVFVYDVEPGASGSIVNLLTREVAAVWQEQYVAKIDKRRIIGETVDGLDLYGYTSNELETNGGLPSVTIEAFGGLEALGDLDIYCLCDGKRVSVPRRVLWEDDEEGSSSAQIELRLSESSVFDWHIELCELEARQCSTGGKIVFRYRFAVVPIREFRLKAASFEFGTFVADYQFQARLAMRVTDTQGEEKTVATWGRYNARTLLKDEFLHVKIETIDYGKTTNAKLALAAIDVELPERLVAISKGRPICLADALELGPANGNVKVASIGWRRNRAAVSLLGSIPMFFKELKRPGEYTFNVFSRFSDLVQADYASPRDKPLRLSICYGDEYAEHIVKPAWTDIDLLPFREGFGFSSWKTLLKADGTHVLALDAPTLHDIRLVFRKKIGGTVIGNVDVSEGSTEAALPSEVVHHLDARKKVVMTIAPIDWLGEADYEYASEFTFSR